MKRVNKAIFATIVAAGFSIAPIAQVQAETITEILSSFTESSTHRQIIRDYEKSVSDRRVRKAVVNPDRCAIILMTGMFTSLNSMRNETLRNRLETYIPKYLNRRVCAVDGKSAPGRRSELENMLDKGLITQDEFDKLISDR